MQIDLYLFPCTKLKFKWFKDFLNIKQVKLKFIEEKGGHTCECIDKGDHFPIITPVAQILRTLINKQDLLKLRSFSKAKDMISKTICQPTEWEKIFPNPTSDKGLISKIYKRLKRLDIKRTNNPIKTWSTT